MLFSKKIIIVLPAYNASKTLKKTYKEIPFDIVDEVILVDDFSSDDTFMVAKELGIKHIIRHDRNLGYGANQKSCYQKALSLDADIVVMLHPDYQYTPKLIHSMCYIIANNVYYYCYPYPNSYSDYLHNICMFVIVKSCIDHLA